MKTAAILAAVAGLLSPALAAKPVFISAIAAHSGSPIHLQPIAANGEHLWIGKPTASFCPAKSLPKGACPPGTSTNFQTGTFPKLFMGAEAPGFQQVFINPVTGAVKYSIAHTEDTMGGLVGGWSLEEGNADGLGILAWRRGLLACPVGTAGVYKIFANLEHISFSEECIGFDAVTSNQTAPAAWQYD